MNKLDGGQKISKIFGHFNEQESSFYIELITTLEEEYTDSNIKSHIRYKSKDLLESLCNTKLF